MDIVRRIGTTARKHLRVIAGLALLVGMAVTVDASREAVGAVDWSIDPLSLGGAIGLLALAPLVQAVTLGLALRRLGASAGTGPTLRVWARSFLLRYEPTGTLGFVYRVRVRDRLGASTAQVLTATGYEQLAAVTAGAVVGLGASAAAGVAPPVLACVLAGGLGATGVALRPALLGDRLARWLAGRGVAVAGPLRGRTLGGMVGLNVAGWAATGLGAWLLARGLLGPGASPEPVVLVGAFALAWVVGVLVPLLPGGLGPRDAALAVALTPALGPGRASVLALALRVVSLAGELLAIGLAEVAARLFDRPDPAATKHQANTHRPGDPIVAPGAGQRAIVVVPTFEEREALPLFVERFAGAASGFELLIVDDGSPDGTGALADGLAADRPWMHVVHRAGKEGLGMAYRAGFRWCLDRGYELIGQMDCDLSHPPERLGEMRARLTDREAGLVLGSRYAPGGATVGWSRGRRVLSRVGCQASRKVLGLPFTDLSGGFKLWRADCLKAIDLDGMLSTGYAFQVESTQLAHLAGARIEEVPFVFSERVAGSSKMTLGISLEGIRVTLALRRRHQPPRRRRVHAAF